MAFVNLNNDEMKFILTHEGKEGLLKHGIFNVFSYFSVSDDGLDYRLDELPNKHKDVNGSHQSSTGILNGCKYQIKK